MFGMGALIGAVVGFTLAGFGFLSMRNPVKFVLFAPGEEGYYQRLVLDRSSRVGLRGLGMGMSLFGSVILTAALGAFPRLQLLKIASDGLLTLMTLLFLGAWGFGVLYSVVQLFRGRFGGWSDWMRRRRLVIELGPIAVYPPMTPAMRREANAFTVGFFLIVAISVVAALNRH
jgi:hypothetical protein